MSGRRSLRDQLEQAAEQDSEELHTLPPSLARRPKDDANNGNGRKRPVYPSEENRTKATYDLDPEVIEAMRQIAVQERLGRRPSKVADALLRWAVGEYEAGRIELVMQQRGPDWWMEVSAE